MFRWNVWSINNELAIARSDVMVPYIGGTLKASFPTFEEAEDYITAVTACPHHDPFHFHHDGCPSCYEEEGYQVPPCDICGRSGEDLDVLYHEEDTDTYSCVACHNKKEK